MLLKPLLRYGVLCSGVICLLLIVAEAPGEELRFNRDVRPILSQKCFVCHGPDEERREADLRLDEREGIEAVFWPGSLEDSEAWRRITSDDPDEQMPPPDSRLALTGAEKATLKKWIEQGAKWQGHWAFIPPRRPDVPEVQHAERVNNPIDAFILARLEEENIEPVGRADRATLIRRLSLDIVGLPPTPAEVDAFVNDPSPDAYENLVDRLLASKHFGERLAIYWLDLVRYADSVGYHKDSHRDCWMYRDWVIAALNDNKPYDEFVTEQLAGDLLSGGTKFDRYRRLLASGLNRMNQTTSEGGAQPKEYLAKYSADRVRNTAAIFLGTTMGCAECHDHKYDPFTTEDFYRFAAFFADIQERGVGYPKHTPMPTLAQIDRWEKLEAELKAKQARLENLASQGESNAANADSTAAEQLRAQIASLEEQIAQLSNKEKWNKTLITNAGRPRPIRVLPRGNWLDESQPEVSPAIPAFLSELDGGDLDARALDGGQLNGGDLDGSDLGGGDARATRLDLAHWITDPNNPLTARVFVNRLWRMYFGEGISRTLDDLGSQGAWPTHPELLDWLALEFVDSGWDIKHIIKLMVTSDAYQRTSVCPAGLRQRDPENRLLARQASFRLPAELIRDNALAVSGLLSPKMYGPSVKPYQPANYWFRLYKDGKYVQDHGEDLYRRGVYTYWRRSFWHPSLRAFDAPAREECLAARPRSNTPLQSLVLLNDPTYVEAARVLATRMMQEVEGNAEARITWAFRRTVARGPDEQEIAALKQLHEQQRQRYSSDTKAAKQLLSVGEHPLPDDLPAAELAAWTSVARAILNMHETITRP